MKLSKVKQILNDAGYICESVIDEDDYRDIVIDWIRRLMNTTREHATELAGIYAESIYDNFVDGIDAQETAQEIIDSNI